MEASLLEKQNCGENLKGFGNITKSANLDIILYGQKCSC